MKVFITGQSYGSVGIWLCLLWKMGVWGRVFSSALPFVLFRYLVSGREELSARETIN